LEALVIQAEGARIHGWEGICRATERANLWLRLEGWGPDSLARLRAARTDAVILLIGDCSRLSSNLLARLEALARDLPVLIICDEVDSLIVEGLLGTGVQAILPGRAFDGLMLAPLVRNAVERFRSASALGLSSEILGILAAPTPLDGRLDAIASAFVRHHACSAAGIRLMDQKGKFPMAASVGFEESFAALVLDPGLAGDGEVCSAIALGRHPGGLFALGGFHASGDPDRAQSLRILSCVGCGGSAGYPCSPARDGFVCVIPIRQGVKVSGILQLRLDSLTGIGPPLQRVIQSIGVQLGAVIESSRVIAVRDLREQRYRALVNAISSAVLSLDIVGGMTEPQPEWTVLTGQTFEPTRARAWLELVHPDDRSQVEQLLEPGHSAENLRETEARIACAPSGEHRAYLLRAVPRLGGDGEQVEWVVSLADVHSEREYERTKKALESQLIQAQRLEAVGRLAGGVAHDFNNLLTIIQGNIYLLRAEPRGDGSWAEELREISSATFRASELTRQLLAFGRRQMVQPERLDLSTVVTGLEKMLRRVLGEDIDLTVETCEGLAPVLADPGQMEQLLMNLALNARDSMPDGGRMTIRTSNAAPDSSWSDYAIVGSSGHQVLLSVSDSGMGMDKDTRSRIFEPYFQAGSKSTQRRLGLSAVYGIVKQHGGHVWVRSEEGVGTTFDVFLPASAKNLTEGDDVPSGTHGAVESVKRQTVLVVEDEAPVRKLVARILKHYGYLVLVASGVSEAMAIAGDSSLEIDLVISDVVMPEMYGPEVLAALRRQRPEVPVLYMSGYADSLVLSECMLGKGSAFIEKPFTPEELVECVRRVIEESSAEGCKGQ
jgi:PAS domain S-box-containing protein